MYNETNLYGSNLASECIDKKNRAEYSKNM